MFPENLVQACFQSMQTYYVAKKPEIDENDTMLTTLAPLLTTVGDANVTIAKPVEVFERRLRYIDGMNVLGSLPSPYGSAPFKRSLDKNLLHTEKTS